MTGQSGGGARVACSVPSLLLSGVLEGGILAQPVCAPHGFHSISAGLKPRSGWEHGSGRPGQRSPESLQQIPGEPVCPPLSSLHATFPVSAPPCWEGSG